MEQNNSKKISSVVKWIALPLVILIVIIVAGFLIWNGGLPYVSNDISTYGDTSYYRTYSSLELFPDKSEGAVKEGQLKKNYIYYADTIFDPTVVLYAEYQYEEDEYWAEVERLKAAQSEYGSETLTAQYNEENFTMPSYVTMNDINECYEYALLEEDTFTIRYVYLQFANKWFTNFSKEYLPENF